MEKSDITQRDRAQIAFITVECVLLAVINIALHQIVPEYINGWYTFGLYVFLNAIFLLAHICVFKRSTKAVALLLIYILAFFTSSILMEVVRIRDGVWVTWTRQDLHSIQFALERYAEDNGGHYPEFLIGGEYTDDISNPDPLLYGYYPYYPRNEAFDIDLRPPVSDDYMSFYTLRTKYPWLLGPYSMIVLPAELTELQAKFQDFYRTEGRMRFGVNSARMGNMGADHRFANAKWGYPFWERKKGSRNLLTVGLQGQFYYKALYKPGSKQPDGYILMVFGSYAFDGMDAFTTVPGGHELDGRLPDGSGLGMGVPVIPELGIEGDGKPDGVYYVLHGGWPVKAF
jgi:hypothetical protein